LCGRPMHIVVRWLFRSPLAEPTCRRCRFPRAREGSDMAIAHYRIYELDPAADHILAGYSLMCASDAATLLAACRLGERRAVAVEVWESRQCVARLVPRRRDRRYASKKPDRSSGLSNPVARTSCG